MGNFSTDTAVEQISETRWQGAFVEGWRIGQTVNGGCVLSCLGRAMAAALPHRDPLAVNGFYLAPSQLGAFEVEVEVLRVNRGTSYASASLYQEGEMKVRATGAFTDLEHLDGENWLGNKPPSVRPFDEVEHLVSDHLEIHKNIDMRLVEGYEVFEKGIAPGTGEFVAWLAHRDGAPCDSVDLLMFGDIMPPPPFTLFGAYGWVPTLELTVQCRAIPAPGPLLGRMTSRHLTASIIESDGDFWDSEGQLVALARQTMKVKPPAS